MNVPRAAVLLAFSAIIVSSAWLVLINRADVAPKAADYDAGWTAAHESMLMTEPGIVDEMAARDFKNDLDFAERDGAEALAQFRKKRAAEWETRLAEIEQARANLQSASASQGADYQRAVNDYFAQVAAGYKLLKAKDDETILNSPDITESN